MTKQIFCLSLIFVLSQTSFSVGRRPPKQSAESDFNKDGFMSSKRSFSFDEAKKVLVCEHIDERISIQYKGETLNHREITKRPKRVNDKKPPYEFKLRKNYYY